MKPNLVDKTCELLKWVCNYRKLHKRWTKNTTKSSKYSRESGYHWESVSTGSKSLLPWWPMLSPWKRRRWRHSCMDQLKLAPHWSQVNTLAARWLPLMWFTSDALLAKHALQMWQNNLPETSDLSAIVRAKLASIPRWLVAPAVPAAANCQHGQYTEIDVTDGTKATGTQMLLTNTAKWSWQPELDRVTQLLNSSHNTSRIRCSEHIEWQETHIQAQPQ